MIRPYFLQFSFFPLLKKCFRKTFKKTYDKIENDIEALGLQSKNRSIRGKLYMKCPICGKEMEKGFTQGADGIIISPNEKVLFYAKTPFNKKEIRITGSFFELSSPAFYCYDCDCMVWKKDSDNTIE